ncbi:hypothetical protein [Actinomadura sp. 9N215]|uniref:hypothetical protein n=1 Tax=Actinomadura sp. 9N215 TaxID=3375150 RepID=UPI0037926CE2
MTDSASDPLRARAERGLALADRYFTDPGSAPAETLAEVIDVLAPVHASPSGRSQPYRFDVAWVLARLHVIRCVEEGAADYAESIAVLRYVVSMSAASSAVAAIANGLLGMVHLMRVMPRELFSGDLDMMTLLRLFQNGGPSGEAVMADVRAAIAHHEWALASPSMPDQMRPYVEMQLGFGHWIEGMAGGDGGGFRAALPLLMKAVTGFVAMPSLSGFPDTSGLLHAMIGLTAGEEARSANLRAGGRADVMLRTGQSIEALTAARSEIGDHPLGAVVSAQLGSMIALRATWNPQLDGLAEGLAHLTEAMAGLERDPHLWQSHPFYQETLHDLAALTLLAASRTFDPGLAAGLVPLAHRVLDASSGDPGAEARANFLLGMALALCGDRAEAIGRLWRAAGMMPPGDELAPALLGVLGGVLIDRHADRGELHDASAADRYLELVSRIFDARSASRGQPGDLDRLLYMSIASYVRGVHGWWTGDPEKLDRAAVELSALLDEAPADHFAASYLRGALGLVLAAGSARRGDLGGIVHAAGLLAIATDRGTAVLPGGGGGPAGGTVTGQAVGGAALAIRAMVDDDAELLDRSIELLDTALHSDALASGLLPGGPVRLAWGLGVSLLARHGNGGDAADQERGLAFLEKARALMADRPGDPGRGVLAWRIAGLHAARGDLDAAIGAGFEALEAHTYDVLLQADAEKALVVARGAGQVAAAVSAWCLTAGRADRSVAALELCRGLVLHAATVVSDLPGRLADRHPELAEEWARARTDGAPHAWWDSATAADLPNPDDVRVLAELLGGVPPGDLRARTLTALTTADHTDGVDTNGTNADGVDAGGVGTGR